MKIIFVLPVSGGGGGAHSVIQEANELLAMGADVSIAINAGNLTSMQVTYSDMPMVVGKFIGYTTVDDLALKISPNSIVIATIFTSVKLVKELMTKVEKIKPAYYVQDYEPLFSPVNTPLWEEAYKSYTLIPDLNLFAKTEWLQNIVFKNHGVKVHKVAPSIDHSVYIPNLDSNKNRICAMVRPKSARRAPHRTMRVLRDIKKQMPHISIEVFGCETPDIKEQGLVSDFEFTNHGILKRHQVSALMQKCDMFLDLSDFQAFGRTGLEAMASGCISVLPSAGGVYEYAEDDIDSIIVDMNDEKLIAEKAVKFLQLPDNEKYIWKNRAIDKAQEFSVRRAALSELRFFNQV